MVHGHESGQGGSEPDAQLQVRESKLQFFLKKAMDEDALVSKLSIILGLELGHIEDAEHIRDGACLFVRYRIGFELGVSVALKEGAVPKACGTDVARQLSEWTGDIVATDVPEHHTRSRDPFSWCVATPSGDVFLVSEDTSDVDRDGLFLDDRTRIPLERG